MKESGLDPAVLLGGQDAVQGLLRRLELWPQLLRRQEEEAIVAAVALPPDWLEEQRQACLGETTLDEWLAVKGWQPIDLDLHLARTEALKRFASQRFGAGLEDLFLASHGAYDQIVYSLLRVSDPSLAQELWIRLEEGETTFAEVASNFSEGPEAARKGVIGPMPIGQVQPAVLAQLLRSLKPGQLHPPTKIANWFVLIRLEQFTPSRFDIQMKDLLLQQQLDAFLNERVRLRLNGQHLDPIDYDHELGEQP